MDALDQPAEHTKASEARLDSAKRRQILEGACHIFLMQGFDAASMGAIAQQAGVSKGTLYVYFKSKEELFGAIVEDQSRQQAEQIFTFDPRDDVEQALRRLGQVFVQYLCRPDRLSSLRTVIAIAHRMPALGARFYQTGPALGISRLKAYIDQQIESGALLPHDSEVAAAQFIDSCASLIFKPVMFNASTVPDQSAIDRVIGMAVGTYLRAWQTPRN